MTEAVQISITPPRIKSQDFELLREEGMKLIRANAPETWTDHNLHDPGITILEACCYAITEMGLRSGIPMRDLLASDASGRKQEFFTAAQILPVSPITANDMRKVLIEHPLVENAWVFPMSSKPEGKLSILLEFADQQLNSNTFSATLPGGFQVDLAFPYWDDEEALAFSVNAIIQTVVFDTPFTPIEGSDAWFARINVTYDLPPDVGLTQLLWIVAQITSPLTDPITQIPIVLSQLSTAVTTVGDNSAADQTLIKQFNRRVINAHASMRVVRRYLKDYRNLCENFAEFQAVRVQEIAITAAIEVNAGVLLESLLADIFFSIDQFIAPVNNFKSLADLLATTEVDKIFEGPLLNAGFLPDTLLQTRSAAFTLYTSDILRVILQHRDQQAADVLRREDVTARNIVAVQGLTLANYLDNRPITSNARDCLHLVESQRHVPRLSLTKSKISFFRNDIQVTYDITRVIQIFNEKKLALFSQPVTGLFDIPLPEGEKFPVSEYYPIQNDLPLIYGVGEAGLPDTATTTRRALALQLQGYMFFFEQLTAGIASQLANLNSFFSGDPELEQTVFQQPLYHLPQIATLLKSYDSSIDWNIFINDVNNGYATALLQSGESREQFLSRRNKVLNHLLAMFGEDMYDKAALVYRRASIVANASSLSLPDLLKVQAAQQQAASRQLIRDKSAFLYDLPALNRDRAQSFGNPVWRNAALVNVQAVPGGFSWSIRDSMNITWLRGITPAATEAAARIQAAETFSLATLASNYTTRIEGPQLRLVIRKPPAFTTDLAESPGLFANAGLATAGINTSVQAFTQLWIHFALIPLEARMYHMLGIPFKERRVMVHNSADYFQELTPAPLTRRFRLWEQPGFGGAQILLGDIDYTGINNAAADIAVRAGIQTAITRGSNIEAYEIRNPAPGVFTIALLQSDGTLLAHSPLNLATKALARAEMVRIWQRVFRLFSMQGFYMIEHLLLEPVEPVNPLDPVLKEIKIDEPYSFQATFVFPSGYARNFIGANPPVPAQPEIYRDPELRKYAEQQIRKACPAHILPRVVWIDDALRGSTILITHPSFTNFENRYRLWLGAYLAEGTTEAAIKPLREDLVTVLNEIYKVAEA
jgi:hypothetical protein